MTAVLAMLSGSAATAASGGTVITQAKGYAGLAGVVSLDRTTLGDTDKTMVVKKGTNLTYTLGGKDYTFNTSEAHGIDMESGMGAYDTKPSNVVVNNTDENGKRGTLYLNPVSTASNSASGAHGIMMVDGGTLTVNSNVNVTAFADYAASGIEGALLGTGEGAQSTLTINGDLTMRTDDDENPWAITSNNTHGNYGPGGAVSSDAPNYTGARWQPCGIRLGKGYGSSVTVNGNVDIAVIGTGISNDFFYPWKGHSDYESGIISLNGGNVRIETPESTTESYFAVSGYNGTTNINASNGKAGTNEVRLFGNVIVMKNDENGSGQPYFYQNGQVNIGLTKANSYWEGVVDNTGKSQSGELNLWLSNGATWLHQSRSLTNGLQSQNMPSPSNNGHYGIYDNVSYVTSLSGGSKAAPGYLIQKDKAAINIADYSGNVTVIYAHDGDGTETSQYTAGGITIGKAAEGSTITLSTDSTGITVSDTDQVVKVLNALAHKLIYSAYTTGEKNLTGYVQIASGLTSSASGLQIGTMDFDSSTGEGSYDMKKTPTTPSESKFADALTGKPGTSYDEYLDENGTYVFEDHSTVNVATDGAALIAEGNAVKVDTGTDSVLMLTSSGKESPLASAIRVNDGSADISADYTQITIDSTDSNASLTAGAMLGTMGAPASENTLRVTGDAEIDVKANTSAMGVYALSGAEAVFDGDLKVTVENATADTDAAGVLGHYHTNGIYAGFGGSSVTVKGDADVKTNGTGLQANTDSSVTVKGGGYVRIDKTEKADQYAMAAEAGTVSMNVKKNAFGEAIGAGSRAVMVEGNLGVLDKSWGAAPNTGDTSSQIDLALATSGSTLTGVAFNEFEEEKAAGKTPEGKGEINLYLQNGATWTNEKWGAVKEGFTGSKITSLTGGADASHAGYILQNDEDPLSISKYSGNTTIFYAHTGSGDSLSDYAAGDVIIGSAAAGSAVTLLTDNTNIKNSNVPLIENVLTSLAQKLLYTGYAAGEENLESKVGIASGLTSASRTIRLGDMEYETDGRGKYIPGTGSVSKIDDGSYETLMMRGARAAAMTSMLAWRDIDGDVLADETVRQAKLSGDAVWARTYKGRTKYDATGITLRNSYWGAQVGYARALKNGWVGGAAVDYMDGDGSYIMGGSGSNKLYSAGVYGTKDLGKDGYFAFSAKVGHAEDEYIAYNEIGRKLTGKYSARAYSATAQYGKRFGSEKHYFEPQLQLTWSHLSPENYDAESSDGEILNVDQSSWNSLVGRVGFEAGRFLGKGGLYARVSAAHEFMGDVKGMYSADDGGVKRTDISLKDTWLEATLGGSYALSDAGTLYADITRTFGGDYQKEWKVNAGLRFLVGSGAAPGSTKNAEGAAYAPAASETASAPAPVSGESAGETEKLGAVVLPRFKEAPADAAAAEGASAAYGDVSVSPAASVSAAGETAAESAPVYQAPRGHAEGRVFELMPVVVTANRTEQPILEAHADISVVTRKEIEAMHMDNVEEALRTVPGVQFLNYGGGNMMNANLCGVRINGSKDIVILVDGVRMTDFQGVSFSGYMYAQILNNVDNIERIEVLRGSAATVYGSGARGGVINIITRNPDKPRTTIDIARGSFGKEIYRFNTMGKADRFSWNAYYDKTITSDTKAGDGRKWPGHSSTTSSGVKLGWEFNEKNKITFNYDKAKSAFYGMDFVYDTPFDGDYSTETYSIRHDLEFGKRFTNTMSYRRNRLISHYSQQENMYDNKNFTYDFFSEQLKFTPANHTIILGLDYSKVKNETLASIGKNAKGDTIFGHQMLENYSYYIQDDWEILPGLVLSGGIRHDKPETNGGASRIRSNTAKSYKLSWDITDKDTIYAGRSQYFILPGLSQLYASDYGNTMLAPASGRTSSIGYNRRFSDSNYLTLNWFETRAVNEIGFSSMSDPGGGKPVNYANALARGWNLQYNVTLSENWSLKLGWAHLFQNAQGDNYALGYAPKDFATFGIYYHREKFGAALDGSYFIRRTNPDNDYMHGWPDDKYALFNLSFDYSPNKQTTFYFKVENLFDKLWAEHTDVIWNKQPGNWYSMPGRSLLLGMQMHF